MLDTAIDPGSPNANIRIVESFLDALKRFDLPRAMSFCADDIVYQNVPLPADRGKAQVERTLTLFAKVAREFDVEMHHVAASDGVVLTERTDVLRGPLLDMSFWVCGTFEIKNGKITLWRDYFDTAGVTLQLLTSPARWAVKSVLGSRKKTASSDAA